MRADAPLDPSVPLAPPSKRREIAAASMSNNITQASHRRSAASMPRRPSTASRSCSLIATFSPTEVGHQRRCPDVVLAGAYLHHPLVGADLRVSGPALLGASLPATGFSASRAHHEQVIDRRGVVWGRGGHHRLVCAV